jgi:four helix bundle protein
MKNNNESNTEHGMQNAALIPHSAFPIPNSTVPHSEFRTPNLKARTKNFALRVIDLVNALPDGRSAEVMGRQLLRSATSVGANYRAACRAKSTADFISKMGTVEEEADECMYWMELLSEAKLVHAETLQPLMAEANELVAITVSSINTAKSQKK